MNVPSVGITGSGLVSGTIVLSSSEQQQSWKSNTSPIVIFETIFHGLFFFILYICYLLHLENTLLSII